MSNLALPMTFALLSILAGIARAGAPIVSVMIEKADAIARVKAHLGCEVKRLGEEHCTESLRVLETFKGTARPGERVIEIHYTRRTVDDQGKPLTDQDWRLPVENGKEYIAFLERTRRSPQPAYDLLDRWAGVLPYRTALARRIRGQQPRPADARSKRDEASTEAINRLDEEGFSKLHRAAMRGDAETVRKLLEAGADPNVRQRTYKGTPLQYAADRGHREVVQLLLKRGAAVDAADRNNRTPLIWAAQEGRHKVVRALLEAGADIKATNHGGWTPLHYAVSQGHQQTAQLLIDRGAPVQVRNAQGKVPLDLNPEFELRIQKSNGPAETARTPG